MYLKGFFPCVAYKVGKGSTTLGCKVLRWEAELGILVDCASKGVVDCKKVLWVTLSMVQRVGGHGGGDVGLIWIVLIFPEDLDAMLYMLYSSVCTVVALLLHYDPLCTVVAIFPSLICNIFVCLFDV